MMKAEEKTMIWNELSSMIEQLAYLTGLRYEAMFDQTLDKWEIQDSIDYCLESIQELKQELNLADTTKLKVIGD